MGASTSSGIFGKRQLDSHFEQASLNIASAEAITQDTEVAGRCILACTPNPKRARLIESKDADPLIETCSSFCSSSVPSEELPSVSSSSECSSSTETALVAVQGTDKASDAIFDLNFLDWSPTDVARFLISLKLEQLLPLFAEVDGATLSQLSEQDLKELGVMNLLQRKKMLGHLERMRLLIMTARTTVSPSVSSENMLTWEFPELPSPEHSAQLSSECLALKDGCAEHILEQKMPVDTGHVLKDKSVGVLQELCEQMETLRSGHTTSVQALLNVVRHAEIEGINAFIQEVSSDLQQLLSAAQLQPQLRIPLFGITGAGKSTLLNALLCADVVPTSGWRACTSVPVELKHQHSSATTHNYEALVQLKSHTSWKAERKLLLEDLLMSDRQRVSRREPVRGAVVTPAEIAYDTLRVVYPEAFTDWRPWPDLQAAERELERIQNKVTKCYFASNVLEFTADCASDVSRKLLDFVDNPEGENEAAFWPLVEKVIISGPFPGGHPNVVLIDAPGVQDANGARSAVVGRLLKEAGGIVIAANIKRAASDRVAKDMLGERFRRQLLMDGHYSNTMAFVATATDDICVSELRQNLGEVAAKMGPRELALLRNSRAKEKILRDCYAGLRHVCQQAEEGPCTDDDLKKDGILPAVFTTSSRDYQRLRGLLDVAIDGPPSIWSNLEDTEIPQLRSWLHSQGLRAAHAALSANETKLQMILQTLSISNAQNCASPGDRMHAVMQQVLPLAEKQLLEQLDAKLKEAREIVQHYLQPEVLRGQQHAAEEAKSSMGRRCLPKGSGGTNHATFKATARRHGQWHEDWNALMADPLNRAIAVKWNLVLNKQMPQLVESLVMLWQSKLHVIQSHHELNPAPFDEASTVLCRHVGVLKDCIKGKQMEVSRTVAENIKVAMTGCYDRAAAQAGTGMDLRQKAIVKDFVFSKGSSLFKSVASFLEDELEDLLSQLQIAATNAIKSAISTLSRGLRHHFASDHEKELLQKFKTEVSEAVFKAARACADRQATCQALEKLSEHAVQNGQYSDDNGVHESGGGKSDLFDEQEASDSENDFEGDSELDLNTSKTSDDGDVNQDESESFERIDCLEEDLSRVMSQASGGA